MIYFGCLWIGRSLTSAILASALYSTSYSVIASTEIAPHQLFAVCALAALICALHPRAWYAAVVFAALACATLEIGIVLAVMLAVVGHLQRRPFVRSLAVFFATLLIVWPAALFRLSALKAYAAMAYLAVARSSPWGHASFLDTWRERFTHSPIEWILIVLAIFLVRRSLYPIALFAALALAATLPVATLTPRYALAFAPALHLLAGLALASKLDAWRRPASFAGLALAVAGLYGAAWVQAAHHPNNPNPRSAAVLTFIQQNGLEDKSVFAPQSDVPTLHYYFPRLKVRAYSGDAIIPASAP